MMKRSLPALALLAALTACGQPATDTTAPASQTAETETPPAPNPDPSSPSYSATPAPGEELPPSQTTSGPVPLEFRHVWAIETADCTKEVALTRIAIAPGAVRWYEGRSVVVSASAPHEGALTMEVDHMSEGQTSRETHVLALDEAGTTLTYKRNGATLTYTRCD